MYECIVSLERMTATVENGLIEKESTDVSKSPKVSAMSALEHAFQRNAKNEEDLNSRVKRVSCFLDQLCVCF